ncbi:FAD-binding oxidoreductase [Mycolicibacterium sp. CBMA 226]|uniref:FAD-binding oxidoreductase n=1 Tax=Mycolicibacterium sp. CBMA 226 TaxID=2606611 RepID=UPI0012DD0D51|nr:FAD-binding oxidoreductase [Mycolicibacterium sp. CBMA 226]MUL79030.1 FAD-binding oxidoreductase [Mycolicibacterium sp. CBMA 226]QGW61352.1 6-hydroxy-D-nicotine oxidase [Mycolicibacterium sp.]
MANSVDAKVRRRGDEGFDAAVDALVWNARKPARRPSIVVHAASVDDVVMAVRLAHRESVQVKAISGGHSWTASSILRDAMLLDLSRLNSITVDADRRVAVVGPGVHSGDLLDALSPHGLFFPAGHVRSVAVGGFLLQGGWGWNYGGLGPACFSVEAVDVVTPSGEVLHCDATQNEDYLWAARGAGPGFFGVVVAFYLRCYEHPPLMLNAQQVYPAENGQEVLEWALNLHEQVPPEIEWMVTVNRPASGAPPRYTVDATSFVADETAAREALNVLDRCPGGACALSRTQPRPMTFAESAVEIDEVYRSDYRWAVDNMWSDERSPAFAAALSRVVYALPESPSSRVVVLPGRSRRWDPLGMPHVTKPDVALSMIGRVNVSVQAAWQDAGEDTTWASAPTEVIMRSLEPFAKGMSLMDENLLNRPAPVFSPENSARLEALRARFDPDARFGSFLTPADR